MDDKIRVPLFGVRGRFVRRRNDGGREGPTRGGVRAMNIRESLEQERASSSTDRESLETADAAKDRAEASLLALDGGRPSASVATKKRSCL